MEGRIDRQYYAGYLSGVADGLNQGRQDTIAELEKIKAEIQEEIFNSKGYVTYSNALMCCYEIVDNHISERKGENNG